MKTLDSQNKTMKERIYSLLSTALPAVDFEEDFIFSQMDSLGVVTVLMILSNEFDIEMGAEDATPKNLRNLDSIVAMVENKLKK